MSQFQQFQAKKWTCMLQGNQFLAGGRPEGLSPPQVAWEDQRGWENVRLSQFHSFWHDNQGVDMKMIFQTKKAANQIKIDIKMTEEW